MVVGKPWMPEDLMFVFAQRAKLSHKEIGLRLARTTAAVRNLCYKRGWTDDNSWTEPELAVLREGYRLAGKDRPVRLDRLAKEIGRTAQNVCRKARELGLTSYNRRRPEGFGEAMSVRQKRWHATHEHPRGALGMHHSEESKARISAAHRALWRDPKSPHNSDARAQKTSDSSHARVLRLRAAGRFETYSRAAGGRRPDLDNRFFRSSWEANYARYLTWLCKQGRLASWEYEPKTFVFEEIKRGTRSYTPDFLVRFPDGSSQWHEVKGWMDPKSLVRLRRFAKFFPDEKLIVVGERVFAALARQGIPSLLPCWERKGRRAQ